MVSKDGKMKVVIVAGLLRCRIFHSTFFWLRCFRK